MNSKDKDELAREEFEKILKKTMIGPGSDSWGFEPKEEVISDETPYQRYSSAILFPPIMGKIEEEPKETLDNEDLDENPNEDTEDLNFNANEKQSSQSTEEELYSNSYYPSNMAISFCLNSQHTSFRATFSFGIYRPLDDKEVKIFISEKGYKSFFVDELKEFSHLTEHIKFEKVGGRGDKGLMYLTTRNEDKKFDDFFNFFRLEENKTLEAYKHLPQLRKIIFQKQYKRIWKRQDFKKNQKINISESTDKNFLLENDKLKVKYKLKVRFKGDKNHIKLQLVNCSDTVLKASPVSKELNQCCLFQCEIKVDDVYFEPLREGVAGSSSEDSEEKELNFIYRKVKDYAIGGNCATIWEEKNGKVDCIKSTFTPSQEVKDMSLDYQGENKNSQEILKLKNLSIWGLGKERVIDYLNDFIKEYKDWIESNKKNKTKKKAYQIIKRQEENYKRIIENIKLLEDESIFRAFQLANTAMFIQMTLPKETRELDELEESTQYNLEDFKNLESSPSYRPFQLAFLLLNLDDIAFANSSTRKEIVDLIWFPTGGGKTEAYLAVCAFTIIWRRIENEKGFEGVSVIMRYTLRLLTAQQFERASRLITALEFLRQQEEFKEILKDEPISIGLWIGGQSTPNKLEIAKKVYDEIEEACKDNSNPQEKNKFQVNSCPWCGTNLISKTPGGSWRYGFKATTKIFSINCINSRCFFHRKLPIQVVDEELYEKPPTLLFATVDKFAIISGQAKAHNLFNSLRDDRLRPDLIIQDELHLLSGPLGSMTGLWEALIESLCTDKNGRTPKIIASTATTKNTDKQIKGLYGEGRRVNVFPPTGISYDDSFFAKELSTSKRKYIGFMPTGKNFINTQLKLLASLYVAKLKVYNEKENKDINNYSTLVSYYNSLRDIGVISNRVGDEVYNSIRILAQRLEIKRDYKDLEKRELNSRILSSKIRNSLKEIEISFDNKENSKIVDLVLATNMFSVGIDIERLNVMLINGIPRNTAEYIQVSSRVGRKAKGLVVTLLNPFRARDKSYMENFQNFHQQFYKTIEPLSITPLTKATINKLAFSLLVSFIRHKVGCNDNKDASNFNKEDVQKLKEIIEKRFSNKSKEKEYFNKEIDKYSEIWEEEIHACEDELTYNGFLDERKVVNSLRDIDNNTFIKIKNNF